MGRTLFVSGRKNRSRMFAASTLLALVGWLCGHAADRRRVAAWGCKQNTPSSARVCARTTYTSAVSECVDAYFSPKFPHTRTAHANESLAGAISLPLPSPPQPPSIRSLITFIGLRHERVHVRERCVFACAADIGMKMKLYTARVLAGVRQVDKDMKCI